MRFYSSAQTLDIQFDLVELAKDKNKDRSRRIYALGGCNLLMEESSRILCLGRLLTQISLLFYVTHHKEDEDTIQRPQQ